MTELLNPKSSKTILFLVVVEAWAVGLLINHCTLIFADVSFRVRSGVPHAGSLKIEVGRLCCGMPAFEKYQGLKTR